MEFGGIARWFSLIAIAGTDQTAARLAVKTLSDLHRGIGKDQTKRVKELKTYLSNIMKSVNNTVRWHLTVDKLSFKANPLELKN